MATTFTVEVVWVGSWVDESSRTLRVQIRAGFEGASDSVARIGLCELTMDNSDQRFSPDYTSGPLYGYLVPRRQVRVKATSGGSTWTLFRGFIEHIMPQAGAYGGNVCEIACVDGMAILEKQRIGVAHQNSKDVDAAVSAVVAVAYTPAATDYSDNGDTLEHYGRSWNPEETTCGDALREICEAVYGRFFVARDGTTTYIARDDRLNSSVATSLTVTSSSIVEDLEVIEDVNRIINLAQVTTYPTETLGAVQNVWQAQSALLIPAGSSRTVYGLFRDDNGERVGATDVVSPVANTDYTVNEKSDGSGPDYTTDPAFDITTTIEATRAKFLLENDATGNLYMTLLKIRGKPIRVWDPETIEEADSTSQTAYEVRAVSLDLPMQADSNFGKTYGEYLVGRFKDPFLEARRLVFESLDVVGSVNVFSLDLMDKVVVSDPETGLSSAGHWIAGVGYELRAGGDFRVEFELELADDSVYCFLDQTGWCELDNVKVGF